MRDDLKPATIREVAQRAGVSIATVSRALSNRNLLHADTLARVDEAVDYLGYRPNIIARDLRRSETRLIMVIVPRLSPYFLDIFRGVENAAGTLGYGVLVGHTDRDLAREVAFLDQVSSGRADGVIMATTVDPAAILTRTRTPRVVLALDGCAGDVLPSVCIDHAAAAAMAAEHLIALGHRRIAHIMGAEASSMTGPRRDGFRRALESRGLMFDESLCVQGAFTVESGEAAMEQLLSRSPRPTAVFAANDEMAIGAIRTLRRHGLALPRDMSVVGFDDQRIAALSDPALTTISVPTYDIGFRAMVQLHAVLTGETQAQRILLPAGLVLRQSTSPPGVDRT